MKMLAQRLMARLPPPLLRLARILWYVLLVLLVLYYESRPGGRFIYWDG